MTCHCRRWSSEASSAQILYQIGQLIKLLLHLLPLAVLIPLFLLVSLLQLLHPSLPATKSGIDRSSPWHTHHRTGIWYLFLCFLPHQPKLDNCSLER